MSLGPAALTRSLPVALGRDPADEVVLIGVTGRAPAAASLASIDVSASPVAPDGDDLADSAAAAVAHAVRSGAASVVVLAYADDARDPDSTAARTAATVLSLAESAGLRVLDVLAVASGRWWSYDCTIPSCCPPEGTPIKEGPTTP